VNPWIGLALSAYSLGAHLSLKRATSGLYPPPYILTPTAKVSLIIPAYQEEKYIGGILVSARNQTYPVHEIIVADSSPDGRTKDVAASWGATVVRARAGNIALARNRGAEYATGDILLFCDADVILASTMVEETVSALGSGAVLVHPREVLYDSTLWNLALYWAQPFRRAKDTTRAIAVSRAVFDAVGGYDPLCNPITERCREDLDFGQRVAGVYGYERFQVLPILIATSARRYKKFGTAGWEHFDVPVRQERVHGGLSARR